MEIDYAFLARAAEYAQDGTLSVIGGDFDQIQISGFPLVQQAMSLVMKCIFTRDECPGTLSFSAEMVAPDGTQVLPDIKSDIALPPPPDDPEKKLAVKAVISLSNVRFPVAGQYRLRLLFDGQETKAIKLDVVQQAFANGPGGSQG